MTTDSGFTLIEALVAMAVLAVAATGFIRATQAHIDVVGRVEARAAGGWVADNALTEARLGLTSTSAPLLGRDWRATVAAAGSPDPDIAALTVGAESGGVHVTMRGFRDTASAGSGRR